jgi:ubiquinone/menaquinone biosynthesis C-methylase UbiE
MARRPTAFAATLERFSGFATVYDTHRPQPPTILGDLLCQLAQSARPDLVVDLGCGTGLSTRFWADKAAQAIGIDPTADMLDQAKRHTMADVPVAYRLGFAHQTGLLTSCADIVTCSQSLHWMDPQPTFIEVARILRPGGVFAAYDHDWPPTTGRWEADAAYVDMLARVHTLEQELRVTRRLLRWIKADHLVRMRASGCFRYTTEVVVHQCDMGNADRLIGLALSQGNVQTLLKQGLTEADLGLDRLRTIADQTLGAEPQPWYWSYRVRIGIV